MIKQVLAVAAALTLNGCLVMVDSDSRALQTAWSEGDVSRLEVGQSDSQFVRDTFGEPTSKLAYADGSEIWKYRNRSKRDTEVGVFLVFNVDVEEERIETLSIEFQDDLITNYWIDETRH